MAKPKSDFVCIECGYHSPKWNGCCPNCGGWNTFEEEKVISVSAPSSKKSGVFSSEKVSKPVLISDIDMDREVRYQTGITEFDRLLGGGIVKGSLILLGGDPGIGKSTLLMQICGKLAKGLEVLYVSGEESAKQLKLRADRLGVCEEDGLYILSETDMDTVASTILSQEPDIVMIDSIQTMNLEAITSSSGSITQVRECTTILQKLAKTEDIPIFLVGHVNKDGNIAGPKVLEHIVDTVLYFEGDSHFSFRILRAVKNRFGSTNEIAVFEMVKEGLKAVENPSAMLLQERPSSVSGSCVCSIMEGSRPILAEVQALVAKSGFGTPRRMCTGFDYNRMSLILAVLEKRAGYVFSALDCYVNVIGGLRLDEPGADLAIALSLVSGLRDVPIEETLLAFGEIGLAGEIRTVTGAEKRVAEAKRLGFTKIVLPRRCVESFSSIPNDVELIPVSNIRQAISILGNNLNTAQANQ